MIFKILVHGKFKEQLQLTLFLQKIVKCTQMIHSKSNNIKFTSYINAREVVDEIFGSLRWRYQNNLGTSMRGSDSIFDLVQLMYYKCHKVTFRGVGSYIDSSDWIKKKKATINPQNKVDKCYQYAVTVALNHKKIKWNPERVSNIKPFTNKYNWEGIDYP